MHQGETISRNYSFWDATPAWADFWLDLLILSPKRASIQEGFLLVIDAGLVESFHHQVTPAPAEFSSRSRHLSLMKMAASCYSPRLPPPQPHSCPPPFTCCFSFAFWGIQNVAPHPTPHLHLCHMRFVLFLCGAGKLLSAKCCQQQRCRRLHPGSSAGSGLACRLGFWWNLSGFLGHLAEYVQPNVQHA